MTVTKKEFSQFLTICKKLTGRNSMSVLAHVAVTSDDNGIIFEATNLRNWIVAKFAYDEEDTILSLAPSLYTTTALKESLKLCSGKNVTITTIDNHLFLNDNMVYQELTSKGEPLVPYDKFPERTLISDSTVMATGEINNIDKLVELSKYTSDDEGRYYMTGIHLSFKDDGLLQGEATDGRSLAYCNNSFGTHKTVERFEEVLNEQGVILGDISPFLKLGLTSFSVAADKKNTHPQWVEFSNDRYTVSISCIDGQFPNTERVIPDIEQSTYLHWQFDYAQFRDNLKKMIAQIKARSLKQKQTFIVFRDGNMKLSGTNFSLPLPTRNEEYATIKVGVNILDRSFPDKTRGIDSVHIPREGNRAMVITNYQLGVTVIAMAAVLSEED